MTTKNITEIIENMPQLPSMPGIVMEALNIIRDPESNINSLANIISKDISLTTEILKMVNSAYYGFPYQITTINKAMALMGLNRIKSLVLSVAVKPMLLSSCGKHLWEHAIRCAVGSQIIANSLNYSEADEAFTMGLLHDIGKIVLEVQNKAASEEANKLINLGANRLHVEKTIFGFTHTEAGEELVKKWKLPLIISTCVRYHHTPQESEVPSTVGIVYIADRIVKENVAYPIIEQEVADIIDFEIADPVELREEIFEKSQLIINALS